MIEVLSIDLSNFCSKECTFCYNHSTIDGNAMWTTEEVISFAKDCIANGVKAISFGGGEPFEYIGIFDIIEALQPLAYLSVTTNGLPFLSDQIWARLKISHPDKIHITIHNPDTESEVLRVLQQISALKGTDITPGVNLLVASDKLEPCHKVYRRLRNILTRDQIILIPQRFAKTPTPKDLVFITENEPFQSPSCLLGCKPPKVFCSVSWDKKVNYCSYACGKQPLENLSYEGLKAALSKVKFVSCL